MTSQSRGAFHRVRDEQNESSNDDAPATAEPPLTDDLFHCCALAAFVAEARAVGGWPDAEFTRRRAYAFDETELRKRR